MTTSPGTVSVALACVHQVNVVKEHCLEHRVTVVIVMLNNTDLYKTCFRG